MATYTYGSLSDFVKAFERHTKAREARVRAAVPKTARLTGHYAIEETIPVAHAELRDSLHTEDGPPGNAQLIADAPHSAAVEVGSRPHMPPLAPLIEWVKLRGMQGLSDSGRIKPTRDWRLRPARTVARALRAMQHGGSLSVDAPEQIARAIQHAISVRGTKPFHYMLRSVPFARSTLAELVKAALEDAG
jgi:hypothetical protein